MLLTQAGPEDILGEITPPGPSIGGNPAEAIGSLIGTSIRLFLLGAGFFMLFYLLWGAFDWIISGGDKERIAKAQNKITNAIIGLFVAIVAIVGFGVIAGDVLGIIKNGPTGWTFTLPTIGK